MIFTKKFWIEASERAVKTFAQFVLALQSGEALNILTVDWNQTLGVALGGALFSYATSIVSAGINKKGTPSLVDEEG
jgi:hypothetical protein